MVPGRRLTRGGLTMSFQDSFGQGLMTGARIGGGARQARIRNDISTAYGTGGMTGAATAAYTNGEFDMGRQFQTAGREDATRDRVQTITGFMRDGRYDEAAGIAETPDELTGVRSSQSTARTSEQEAAAQTAGRVLAVASLVEEMPEADRLAYAQSQAASLGLKPEDVRPEHLTPQGLRSLRMQALGVEGALEYEQKERDSRRIQATPFGLIYPEGMQPPSAQSQALGSTLPPGWTPVNPNQPAPGQPVRATSERAQTPTISFPSSNQARSAVAQLVPGVNVTNGDRTPDDTARIRRQGYTPSDTSFHLQGQALDLTPPRGMTMAQLEQQMRQAGFRVLNEGHHVHVSW